MKLQYEELEISEEMMSDTATRVVGICGLGISFGTGVAIVLTLLLT
ncbi:MAG: hypothetical protein K6B15_03560 [Parasporobacterium sp.]|nr:hypothetical protein [Parasporobacterium sp.]